MHNAYLRMEVERELTYTQSALFPNNNNTDHMRLFIEDKHAANFFQQMRIYCNDKLLTESLDFEYETNILVESFSDTIKYRYPEPFTSLSTINLEDRNVCSIYASIDGAIANESIITVKYAITILMITFHLLARIRYLPTFFGTWKIEFVPTLENMITKILAFHAGNAGWIYQNVCTHNNRELAFQFYNVGTRKYYVIAAAN
jgi:hypothetical protein